MAQVFWMGVSKTIYDIIVIKLMKKEIGKEIRVVMWMNEKIKKDTKLTF